MVKTDVSLPPPINPNRGMPALPQVNKSTKATNNDPLFEKFKKEIDEHFN